MDVSNDKIAETKIKMRKLIWLIICSISISKAYSQEVSNLYDNPPIIITIQFHSVAMPFQNLKSHFSNMGIGIGTEFSHSGIDQDWAQTFKLVWHRNKIMGDGISIYTQAVARPDISSTSYGEIKLGVGYQYLFRPSNSFRIENGAWTDAGKKGKGMLMIPINVGAGYLDKNEVTAVSPFINYQWMVFKGYNISVPIIPQSVVIGGVRIHK